MNEQRIVGRAFVDRDKAVCIECHEPFKYGVNVFTTAGMREITISGFCEKCFDAIFEEQEE